MANNVFANGREISCKKADGKTICAFPDICMTPPVTGVTPNGVPIPYPNTGMAKDTANGSRTVKISDNEIIKKNVSYFKTSYGDEAGCATPPKKGIITGTIQGKVYFTSWSMDVKVEGKNVARHLDTTTHNHGSNPNEGIPWLDLDSMKIEVSENDCETLTNANNNAREKLEEKTKDKTLVGVEGDGKGTTVSSAKFTPIEGSASLFSAHNRQKAQEKIPEYLVEGGNMEDRKSGKSQLCASANHTHAKPSCQKSGHAEARIFDTLGDKQGELVLNIDWRPKKNRPSKMPCKACHKIICAAKGCGIEVFICGKDNSKKDVPCPMNKDNYLKLKLAVDGR